MLSVVVADLSYRFVEQPGRHRWPRAARPLFVVALVAAVGVGAAVVVEREAGCG